MNVKAPNRKASNYLQIKLRDAGYVKLLGNKPTNDPTFCVVFPPKEKEYRITENDLPLIVRDGKTHGFFSRFSIGKYRGYVSWEDCVKYFNFINHLQNGNPE